ncbi:ROK family protein [Kineosporia babensis]
MSAQVLKLVVSGRATSRAELSRQLKAAPSTISVAVQALLEQGLITEEGTGASTGGRPRKILRPGGGDRYALVADLGGSHARIGTVGPGAELTDARTIALDITQGPQVSLERLVSELSTLTDRPGVPQAVGIALPGPVDVPGGFADSPSRMPGWDGFRVRDWLTERLELPVAVGNDANFMALGEHSVQDPARRQSVTVKAGSAIGAGIVIDGSLYQGATGAAGDITHVRVTSAGQTPCGCGNTGCLETVASGAALARLLRDRGVQAHNAADVVALVRAFHPEAGLLVRNAGRALGEVLAANVSFFNPDAVYLGGVMSTLEPFVAAVRSQLYESCHPLATQRLVIEQVSLGADAGLVGAAQAALSAAVTHALTTENP